MRRRLRAGTPAEITFTADFHQLAAGDLRAGAPVLLRYDPDRLVPAGEPWRFGDPDRPVQAHLRFRADGPVREVALASEAGLVACPDRDPTGQGSMLSARVDLPEDADRLVVWFSWETAAGATVWDSALGANYRFGFVCRELDVLHATVTRRPDAAADRFELAVQATAAAEDVTAPFVLASDPACARHELRLHRTGGDAPDGKARWEGAIDVPHGAIARFKLRYRLGTRRLTDDNATAWYLAPAPAPDRPPPPPPALLAAAAAWR